MLLSTVLPRLSAASRAVIVTVSVCPGASEAMAQRMIRGTGSQAQLPPPV